MARFAASARTVDMLGRQSIASIPTAISELFKNAHDAYATEVQADYIVGRRALLLRDNGVGMSSQDFLNRWLTLGTDSKATGGTFSPTAAPPGHRTRAVMGEKGVGRLSVASIGPQVLVLTRPRELPAEQPAPVTVALVQWTLFTIPGLLLDEISVPVISLASLPSAEDLHYLTNEVLENLSNLEAQGRVPGEISQSVRLQLAEMSPRAVLEHCQAELRDASLFARHERRSEAHRTMLKELCSGLTRRHEPELLPVLGLRGPSVQSAPGTSFLVIPAVDDLDAYLEEAAEDGLTSEFERLLIGFTNTMIPSAVRPDMKASFMVHRPNREPDDVVSSDQFWAPEDFAAADHDISGRFDETGLFEGTVAVYGREPVPWIFRPPTARNKLKTACGPFALRIGYLQGNQRESRLPPDQYSSTSAKLRRISGLYVYRDGVRVLPYGSVDVDYLGIEERRTLNAGRYVFSYRRMFGAVEISKQANPGLRDKASREGLMNNQAYRDMRDLLKDVLIGVAADFFRAGGEHSENYLAEKTRLREADAARRQQSSVLRRRRDEFRRQVEAALDDLALGRIRERVEQVRAGVESAIHKRGGPLSPQEALELETQARRNVLAADASLRPVPPPDLALDDDAYRDLRTLRMAADEFRKAVIVPSLNSMAESIAHAVRPSNQQEFSSLRFGSERSTIAGYRDRILREREALVAELGRANSTLLEGVNSDCDTMLRELEQLEARLSDPSASVSEQEVAVRAQDLLAGFMERTGVAASRLSASSVEQTQQRIALQERLVQLESAEETNTHLLLLGQAVQVIDHELEGTVKVAREALQRLRRWGARNPTLASLIDEAIVAFHHLDGYLSLFAPLQRRLRRQRVRITGKRIAGFLEDLFAERLRRDHADLRATPTFQAYEIQGFTSTFFPVFTNLVDNAIYWAVEKHGRGGGVVELDIDEGDLVVRDNGRGIPTLDAEVVFDRGFTRRRGGRGLGLAISRDALQREGWALSVDPPGHVYGAVLRIRKLSIQETE